MPHQRLRCSEANKILKRANRLMNEAVWQKGESQNPMSTEQKWITLLFLQIQVPMGDSELAQAEASDALAQYRALARRQVATYGGYLLAEAEDSLLAFLSSAGNNCTTEIGISMAVSIMDELAVMNRHRLAQDLVPFRLGIGLDSGPLPLINPLETPQPVLEKYIRHARSLGELNRQTPFPAIFISERTASRLRGQHGFNVQNLGNVQVDKRREPIEVFALMRGNRMKTARASRQ